MTTDQSRLACTALREGRVVKPLDRIAIEMPGEVHDARLVVSDSRGRVYVDRPVGDGISFKVGGALGWQIARLIGSDGRETASWRFRVEAETVIEDGEHGFGEMLRGLQHTMYATSTGDGSTAALIEGKLYHYFFRWLRDHTHTLKGMKYFTSELRTGLELYADTQRADGMVYDRVAAKAEVQGWRDYAFAPGDFIRTLNSGTADTYTLQRIPVENDVEFLFLECLYRTWQATGDTDWMARHLDCAKRAVAYATTDRYRWSEKFGLPKRAYTIDTWDFMHRDDVKLTQGDNVCDVDRTAFGVMHGDTTGLAAGCAYLATMLREVGRASEARAYDCLSSELFERLDCLAWDERGHYRHHVTEAPEFERDIGCTVEADQVSLSNAYAINRGIDPRKARAIVATYRRIRGEKPAASPGEWFTIYPPFESGFEYTSQPWQYMNGGVTSIVAGELARGAFAFGDNEYGIDILQRLRRLMTDHGGHLPVCLHGNPITDPPERGFTTIDLAGVANLTTAHDSDGGWGEPGNDLSRFPTGDVEFRHVPFRVAAPARGVAIAHDRVGFAREQCLHVGGAHASMYLLHTASVAPSDRWAPMVELDVVYADGETERVYLTAGKQLDRWFMPGSEEKHKPGHTDKLPRGWPEYQLAWRGGNDRFDNVGVYLWGWDNPRPGTPIEELVFRATRTASAYFLLGVTMGDSPIWFPTSEMSYGIPAGWGAAAVVYALVEGLAGVVDATHSFEHVVLSPRWANARVDDVSAAVVYPASGGYVAYELHHDRSQRCVTLIVTGSGNRIDLHLPATFEVAEGVDVFIDGEPERFAENGVLSLRGLGPHEVTIMYRDVEKPVARGPGR
ncbi:MAG: hypothetical protein AAFY08_01365 [Planctomycetota bacterium]